MAKVSCRLVPKQDPAEIGRLARRAHSPRAPREVRVTIRHLHGGGPGAPISSRPDLRCGRRGPCLLRSTAIPLSWAKAVRSRWSPTSPMRSVCAVLLMGFGMAGRECARTERMDERRQFRAWHAGRGDALESFVKARVRRQEGRRRPPHMPPTAPPLRPPLHKNLKSPIAGEGQPDHVLCRDVRGRGLRVGSARYHGCSVSATDGRRPMRRSIRAPGGAIDRISSPRIGRRRDVLPELQLRVEQIAESTPFPTLPKGPAGAGKVFKTFAPDRSTDVSLEAPCAKVPMASPARRCATYGPSDPARFDVEMPEAPAPPVLDAVPPAES